MGTRRAAFAPPHDVDANAQPLHDVTTKTHCEQKRTVAARCKRPGAMQTQMWSPAAARRPLLSYPPRCFRTHTPAAFVPAAPLLSHSPPLCSHPPCGCFRTHPPLAGTAAFTPVPAQLILTPPRDAQHQCATPLARPWHDADSPLFLRPPPHDASTLRSAPRWCECPCTAPARCGHPLPRRRPHRCFCACPRCQIRAAPPPDSRSPHHTFAFHCTLMHAVYLYI